MVYSTQDESFSKNCNQRKVRLQVDYPDIEISAATLHVIASYSGLQYFLFQWPIFSFLLAVGIFFTPVLVSVLVLLCIIICVSYGGSYQDIHSHVLEDNNEEHPDATRCIDEDEGNYFLLYWRFCIGYVQTALRAGENALDLVFCNDCN